MLRKKTSKTRKTLKNWIIYLVFTYLFLHILYFFEWVAWKLFLKEKNQKKRKKQSLKWSEWVTYIFFQHKKRYLCFNHKKHNYRWVRVKYRPSPSLSTLNRIIQNVIGIVDFENKKSFESLVENLYTSNEWIEPPWSKGIVLYFFPGKVRFGLFFRNSIEWIKMLFWFFPYCFLFCPAFEIKWTNNQWTFPGKHRKNTPERKDRINKIYKLFTRRAGTPGLRRLNWGRVGTLASHPHFRFLDFFFCFSFCLSFFLFFSFT